MINIRGILKREIEREEQWDQYMEIPRVPTLDLIIDYLYS